MSTYTVSFYRTGILVANLVASVIVEAESESAAITTVLSSDAVGNYMGGIWDFDRMEAVEA